jgi:hypothetical protein
MLDIRNSVVDYMVAFYFHKIANGWESMELTFQQIPTHVDFLFSQNLLIWFSINLKITNFVISSCSVFGFLWRDVGTAWLWN